METTTETKPSKAAAVVLVENRTARVLGPSYTEGGQGAIVRLLPGINKVPEELWRRVAGSKLVLEHERAGLLNVLDDSPELAKMPLTRAAEVVAGTFDKAMLRGWRETEERKPVLEAIDAQLERLDGSKPDKEDEEEGQPSTAPSSLTAVGVDVSKPRGKGR